MQYIFIDESGDLGFVFSKQKTTNFFIVTAVITESKRGLEKAVRNIHQNLHRKYRSHHSVFHAALQNPQLNLRLYNKIASKDFEIVAIVADKRLLSAYLKAHQIYVEMIEQLFQEIFSKYFLKKEFIIAKRETNLFFNKQMMKRLEKISVLDRAIIFFKTPAEEKCLQVADMMSWAIFQKIERKNDIFTSAVGVEKISILPFKTTKPHALFMSNHPEAHA